MEGASPVAKQQKDYGTGIPRHEMESIARMLLPAMQAFFESEEGQREFEEWKAQQAAKRRNRAGQRPDRQRQGPGQRELPRLLCFCGF